MICVFRFYDGKKESDFLSFMFRTHPTSLKKVWASFTCIRGDRNLRSLVSFAGTPIRSKNACTLHAVPALKKEHQRKNIWAHL